MRLKFPLEKTALLKISNTTHKYATYAHAENDLFHREQSKDCMFMFQCDTLKATPNTTNPSIPVLNTKYKLENERALSQRRKRKSKQNWQMHTQHSKTENPNNGMFFIWN